MLLKGAVKLNVLFQIDALTNWTLERFSIERRKTKTKVITLANH